MARRRARSSVAVVLLVVVVALPVPGALSWSVLVAGPLVPLLLAVAVRGGPSRRTSLLLGGVLGLTAGLAWAWLSPLTEGPFGTGARCGSALLWTPGVSSDGFCFSEVVDQYNRYAYFALLAVVASLAASLSAVLDNRRVERYDTPEVEFP